MKSVGKYQWMSGLMAAASLLMAAPSLAAVPNNALVEGTLGSGGGPAADGPYAVTVAIYKDAQGGLALWTEKANIDVKSGQFSHVLGSVTPVNPAILASAAYLGIAVGQDPELPRKPLHAVLYAQRAGVAEVLACSGCVTAGHLEQGLQASLGEFVKTSAISEVAKTGNFADLVGGPNMALYAKTSDLSGYAKTADLKKVATTGSYKDLADLPILPQIGKSCGTGLVVAGIKADGSLDCIAGGTASLPADGIDEISNNLIFNQFVDKVAGTKDIQIKDGFAAGSTDTIAFPSVGLAQKIWVEMDLSNSDVSKVLVELYAPGKTTPYKLYAGGKTGTAVVAKYNDDTQLLEGDMNKDWLGKDIAGSWTMIVKDTAALQVPPGTPPFEFDGKYNWSINLQTLSSKKIQIKGNLIVDGTLTVGGAGGNPLAKAPLYRWATWSTYDYWSGWVQSDQGANFGGVTPSQWGDSNAVAWSMNGSKDVLRTLFNKEGKIYKNTNVWSEGWRNYSSTNSKHLGVWLRIKNTTTSDVTWTPHFWYTSGTGWGMKSSITVNGGSNWQANDAHGSTSTNVGLSIPKGRTSSVVFAIASQYGQSGEFCYLQLSFINDSLTLPQGLEFVDDFDSSTGGWEQ